MYDKAARLDQEKRMKYASCVQWMPFGGMGTLSIDLRLRSEFHRQLVERHSAQTTFRGLKNDPIRC